MERIIIFILSALIMISGLLMISYFSIFGLHASEKIVKFTDRYITAPLPDRYECELKWINENTLGQFRNNQPEIITCVYKCQDANGRFDWIDWAKDDRGCKFRKRMYKTDIIGEKKK